MTEVFGNIKALLADMQGKGLSDKAKLVAILESCGIAEREEMENLLECKASTLREARRALKIQRQNSITAGNPAPEIQRCAGNPAPTPEIQRSEPNIDASAYKTTRATNELPTEVLSCLEVDSPLSDPQPDFAPVELVTPLVETPIIAKPPSSKRGTRLPDAWELPAEWRVWAQVNFPFAPQAQIDDQAAQFHDYWISKPGAQAAKLNWEATWRNWCRKGLSAAGNVRKPQSTGVFGNDPLSQTAAIIAKLRAKEAANAAV